MSKKQKLTYSQMVKLNRANLAARDETNAANRLCAQIAPLRTRVDAAIAYGQECERAAQESPIEHEHIWGKWERARFTGNPHRKCTIPDCRFITLDNDDD